jgi:16S rRNA (guanine966-N2)-methyltransferase
MRIISGQWRGRRLAAPTGQQTRPTADRARETLFSMLASRLGGFTDLAVADLFAGSGALGFEALSRGAASCLFVDADRAAIAAIRTNADALGASGAEIRQLSALALPSRASPLDLVMLDPPYDGVDSAALLDALVGRGYIGPRTMVSLETGKGSAPAPERLTLLVSRPVGKTVLHLFAAEPAP